MNSRIEYLREEVEELRETIADYRAIGRGYGILQEQLVDTVRELEDAEAAFREVPVWLDGKLAGTFDGIWLRLIGDYPLVEVEVDDSKGPPMDAREEAARLLGVDASRVSVGDRLHAVPLSEAVL
jgi:hypothetical protein